LIGLQASGNRGTTYKINLGKVKIEMLEDALTTSYCAVAPKKLAAQVMEKYQEE
jgi:hypothetical protein